MFGLSGEITVLHFVLVPLHDHYRQADYSVTYGVKFPINEINRKFQFILTCNFSYKTFY